FLRQYPRVRLANSLVLGMDSPIIEGGMSSPNSSIHGDGEDKMMARFLESLRLTTLTRSATAASGQEGCAPTSNSSIDGNYDSSSR
ncbi:unnamed protein product, partial [Sphacelaria rigidula]